MKITPPIFQVLGSSTIGIWLRSRTCVRSSPSPLGFLPSSLKSEKYGSGIFRLKFALLAVFCFLPPAYADGGVQQSLSNFFNKLGGVSNNTAGAAYQDQSAGYYSGGSLYARNTVHNAQLANLQLPGYRAGCGGIDMHFGAMSFIKGEELVKALRAIGSNMSSYALMLAIETMSPQVKNIMTELNALAQQINNANVNSCKMSATILGAVLPQSDAANHHLCTMIGNDKIYGAFSDYAAANQGCGPGGRRSEVLREGQKDPRFAKMLGTEFNLAWKAIQENNFLKTDKALAEFFMTISGTIISKEIDNGFEVSTKASLVDRDTLLTTLLQGGTATVYGCADYTHCLAVSEKTLTIGPSQCLVSQVKAILVSIQNKIYEDEELSPTEKAFLDSTRLPFYKILNVSTAYLRGKAPIDISNYAELAAMDVLFQYLSEIIGVIEESVGHIKSAQVDSSQINKFEEGLRLAKNRVHQRRMASFKDIEQVINMVKKTELLEKTLTAKLGIIGAEGL